MKRKIPFALTTLRLLLGPVSLLCAVAGVPRLVFVPILISGTVSDILDGILARRFGVATPALRRYDSVSDIIYYLFVLGAMWVLCKPVMVANSWAIAVLVLSEAASILTCFMRFGKYPATHSYLAKFYGICLLSGLIALLAFNAGNWAVITLAIVAAVTNIEIIVMHLIAKRPPVDVASIFVLLKKGH